MSDGHFSLVHLAHNTFGMPFVFSVLSRFLDFSLELDSKKASSTGLFGHKHRPIWCHANLRVKSLWQFEQSRHSLLMPNFRNQNLGHVSTNPDGKGQVVIIYDGFCRSRSWRWTFPQLAFDP